MRFQRLAGKFCRKAVAQARAAISRRLRLLTFGRLRLLT